MIEADFFNETLNKFIKIDAGGLNCGDKDIYSLLQGKTINECINIMYELINENTPIIIEGLPVANCLYLIKNAYKNDGLLYHKHKCFYRYVDFYEALLEVEHIAGTKYDDESTFIFRVSSDMW